VPGFKSFPSLPATVTVPGLTGWRNRRWLPLCRSRFQPSARSILINLTDFHSTILLVPSDSLVAGFPCDQADRAEIRISGQSYVAEYPAKVLLTGHYSNLPDLRFRGGTS